MQSEDMIAVFQGLQGSAAYVRVRFGGEAPTLPATQETARPSQSHDFDPDPEGPIWGA
jgi:hypothetical protein